MAEEIPAQPFLPAEFEHAAHPAAPVIEPPRVTVSLPIDADVLDWFQNTGPSDWQRRMNDLMRFHMETILQMERDWEADAELAARIGQETTGPQPA